MTEIRIMTVRQPWAWAIIHGGKDVENRVRNIAGDYRGPVAIHAGLRFDDDGPYTPEVSRALTEQGMWSTELTRGAIIGVVDLVGVHFGPFAETWDVEAERNARCTPWADADRWHLELAHPRPLRTPVPFKGSLGLRRFDSALIEEVS